MAMMLIRVEVEPGQASLDQQKKRLQLADGDVDAHFGLRRIDPVHGVYAMKVRNEAAHLLAGTPGVSGPFANPAIGVTGPSRRVRARRPSTRGGSAR
jgi:hypothetical protein